MMKCPNCGTENRLGAIFCRSCGIKLELDEITAETFEEKTGVVARDKVDKKKQKRKFIYNLIGLIILLAFIFAVYLALQIPRFEEIRTSSDLLKSFKRKKRNLNLALLSKVERVEQITEAELNSYIASMMINMENEGRKIRINDIWVFLEEDNRITILLDLRVFGRRIIAQYFGKLNVGNGNAKFQPNGVFAAKLGKLPYPTFLMRRHCKNVLKNLEEDKELLEKLSEVEIKDGKIIARVKKL